LSSPTPIIKLNSIRTAPTGSIPPYTLKITIALIAPLSKVTEKNAKTPTFVGAFVLRMGIYVTNYSLILGLLATCQREIAEALSL